MNSTFGDLTPGLRRRSEIIENYPWRTMMIQNRADLVPAFSSLPDWQSFATTTAHIERDNLTDSSKKCQQIRVGLRYKPLQSSVPATGHVSKESQADAARYLARLRLADIILLLNNYPESPNTGKQEVVVSSPWSAGEILTSVKKLLAPFRAAGPHLMEVSIIDEGDSLVTKHLKKLVKYSTMSALATIQMNVIMVALQVSFFASGEDDYERFLACHKRELCASEIRLLNTILGRDLYLLRRPLYMACHLTVLLAISAHPLTRQGKYSEIDMVNDASSIGRPNKEIIVRIEKMVWECVFDIAFGRDTLENALKVLHNKVPFEEIDSLQLEEDGALRITALGPVLGPDGTRASESNAPITTDSVQRVEQLQGSLTGLEKPISRIDIIRQTGSSQWGEEQENAKLLSLEHDKDSEVEEEMEVEQEMSFVHHSITEDEETHMFVSQSDFGTPADLSTMEEEAPDLLPASLGNSVATMGSHEHKRVTDEGDSEGDADEDQTTNEHGCNDGEVWPGAEMGLPQKKRKTALFQDADVAMEDGEIAQNKGPQSSKTILGKRNFPEADDMTSSSTRASLRLRQRLAASLEKSSSKDVQSASPRRRNSRPAAAKKPLTPTVFKDSIVHEEDIIHGPVRHRAFTPFMDLIYGDDGDDTDDDADDDEGETPSKNVLIQEPMPREMATQHVIKNVQLWDAFGEVRVIESMFFTDPDEKAFFEGLLDAARDNYKDGKPLHVSCPSESVYSILDAETFDNMCPRDRQAMFAKRNIVLKNFATPAMTFDRKGLSQITNLYLPQTVYDLTLPKGKRDTIGTADLVIRNADLDPAKPMNSLDNPMPDGPQDGAAALATDLLAFKSVNFIPEGEHNVQDASKHRKWGLFATEGAITLSHLDAEGLATAIDVLIGGKAWVTIRPEGSFDPRDFADPRQFRQPFELDFGTYLDWRRVRGGVPKNMVVEIILLTPGTRYLMQPNCLHAAYTFGKTVCHGAHFYAVSTLRRTFCGLVFTLVQEKFLTNTTHPPLRLMIRRIVQYMHMNIIHGYHRDEDTHCFDSENMTLDNFEELFSVISLGILSAILDPRTYCFDPDADDDEKLSPHQKSLVKLYDCNSLPESERIGAIYTRGLAYELLDWFISRYELLPVNNDHAQMPTSDRIHTALAHEAFGIYVARDSIDREGLWAPNVSLEAIRRQLSGLASPGSVMHQSITQLLHGHDTKLTPEDFNLLYDWKSVMITSRDPLLNNHHRPWNREKLFITGQTQLDTKNVQWLSSSWVPIKAEPSVLPASKSKLVSSTRAPLHS